MGATCSKCGKVFRFAGSIAKYHGWCGGDAVTAKTATVDPLAELLERAEAAGRAAGDAATPTPMVVVERGNPWDDSSPVARTYAPVADGVCGFAWVNLKGNTALARAARKRYADRAVAGISLTKGYPTGLNVYVHAYGQSYERKVAFARAYAAILRAEGHAAHVEDRLD